MNAAELTISPQLGLWLVLKRARDFRLRWLGVDQGVYDGGRPLQRWLYPHLDVAMADSYVRFVSIADSGHISCRALLTAHGAALLPMLDLIHRAGVGVDLQQNALALGYPIALVHAVSATGECR